MIYIKRQKRLGSIFILLPKKNNVNHERSKEKASSASHFFPFEVFGRVNIGVNFVNFAVNVKRYLFAKWLTSKTLSPSGWRNKPQRRKKPQRRGSISGQKTQEEKEKKKRKKERKIAGYNLFEDHFTDKCQNTKDRVYRLLLTTTTTTPTTTTTTTTTTTKQLVNNKW